jgi:hypothetical protein
MMSLEVAHNAQPDIPKGRTVSDNVDNIILEHLKRFQAKLDRIEQKLDEQTMRMGNVEVSLAAVRRDLGHGDEVRAEQSVRLDHLSQRIDRIERRLELKDA